MSDETILEAELLDVSDAPQAAMDTITRAEIDMAITTAKRYPRQIRRFVDDVTSMATIDRETAEGCFYSLRRQGKTIQGESVRLAELAVNAWGNIRAGARILGETDDGKFIRAMGVCHDLEKNVYVAIECQRRITRKDGRKYDDDMIGVTANAAAAIGFRNAVFKVIPKAMVRSAFRKCIDVATGDAKTLTERRESVFQRLAGLNPMITPERILSSLGRPTIDEVTLDDVAHLIGLGTAIRDGEQNIDDAFPAAEAASNGSRVDNLASRLAPEKPAGDAKPDDTEGPPWATISPKQVEELRARGLALKLDSNDLLKLFKAGTDVGRLEHLNAEGFEGYVEALDEFEAKAGK